MRRFRSSVYCGREEILLMWCFFTFQELLHAHEHKMVHRYCQKSHTNIIQLRRICLYEGNRLQCEWHQVSCKSSMKASVQSFQVSPLICFLSLQISSNNMRFLQSHRMTLSNILLAVVVWMPFGRTKCNWQCWETCCFQAMAVLFLNTFAHVVHYNTISRIRIAWHNKLCVYTSCIWDKTGFYHCPSSIKYWLAQNR